MKYIYYLLSCLIIQFTTADAAAEDQTYLNQKWKDIKYVISLTSRMFSQEDWWNQIAPYPIFLGALPLKNQGHDKAIQEHGVTRILSMVEDFELEPTCFFWPICESILVPVTGSDWSELGIEVVRVPSPDYYPVEQDNIRKAVEALDAMMKEGQTIYVHCKAGVGRSAAIVIAYLIEKEGFSFEDAYTLVRSQRPCVNLYPSAKSAIFQYCGLDDPGMDIQEDISLDPDRGFPDPGYSEPDE